MFIDRFGLVLHQFRANRPNFKRHKVPKRFAKSKPHFTGIVETPIVPLMNVRKLLLRQGR
jgi:hypothetical protein